MNKSVEKFYIKGSLTIYFLILIAVFLICNLTGCSSGHKYSSKCFTYSSKPGKAKGTMFTGNLTYKKSK